MTFKHSLLAALLLLGGCPWDGDDGSSDSGTDAFPADGGTPDGGNRDAGDSGSDPEGGLDAGNLDAGDFDAGETRDGGSFDGGDDAGDAGGVEDPLPLTPRDSDLEAEALRAVAYFERYVAIGDGGAITTSDDGTDWTKGDFGGALSGVSFSDIAASPTATNHFVVAAYGAIGYSPDGLTWTEATGTGVPVNAYGVAWGDGIYVTVGSSGEFGSSGDGASWTTSTDTDFASVTLGVVTWTGSQFVATGSDYPSNAVVVATSPDGDAWTRQDGIADATDQVVNAIASDGDFVVAVGNGSPGFEADVVTSSDGVAWQVQESAWSALEPVSGDSSLFGVAWSGSLWVAVGYNAAIIVSSNATDWEPGVPPGNVSLNAITGDGPRIVLVGGAATIYTAEKP